MQRMMAESQTWFSKVNPNVDIYSVFSEQGRDKNKQNKDILYFLTEIPFISRISGAEILNFYSNHPCSLLFTSQKLISTLPKQKNTPKIKNTPKKK